MIASLTKFFFFFISLQVIENLSRKIMENGKSLDDFVTYSRGVNRRTDRRILEIFLHGFRIQSEILTDFRILQLQRNADSSIFCARILDFACNTNIFAPISDSGRKFNGGFGQ